MKTSKRYKRRNRKFIKSLRQKIEKDILNTFLGLLHEENNNLQYTINTHNTAVSIKGNNIKIKVNL